ncbi:MAG: protein kinase, partial [Planctomycetes bacterium]|nr:protein kinase [Planctomycetota bacterium]
MTHDEGLSPRPRGADPHAERVEAILARYIGRLNDGESLDRERIRAEVPDVADEILEALEVFSLIETSGEASPSFRALGDHTLLHQIGRGGMGIVYEAWQNSMDRRVALKVLPSGLSADTKTLARFLREAKVAGKLQHPNIVSVHGIGVDQGTPFYSMEFVEGETLAQILARWRRAGGREQAGGEATRVFGSDDFDLTYHTNLAKAFAGVAEGLQHAHANGIIHRDIKPSNLILDREGRLRILDFGLARLEGQESLTLSGDFLGTPLYMSPEQARRRKVAIDHRTDVYSLGATMYEMLTWNPPFKGRDHRDTLSRIIEDDPVAPRRLAPAVPGDLETIVLKCLRKDAADRYGTAEALAQDLRRFVRGDPIEARPLTALEVFVRQARRHVLKAGIGALVVLLAVVTILFVRQYRVNLNESRARVERERRAAHRAEILRAVSDIGLGEMLLRTSSSDESRLDPKGFFTTYQFEQVVKESPLIPVERALGMLEGAVPFPPGEYEGYYHWARALELERDIPGALEKLAALFALEPDFVPGRALAAKLLRAMGDEEGAAAEEKRARAAVSEPWEAAWLGARRAEAEKEWEAAAEAYSRLLVEVEAGVTPYQGIAIETWIRRGQALLRIRDYERAISDFILANKRRPEAGEPYLLLGGTYHRMGKPEFTEAVFQRLYASRAPESLDHAAVWIAVTYMYLGDYREALPWARRIGVRVLGDRLASAILHSLHRFDEAEAAARAAIAGDPENAMSHLMLARALQAQKRLKEAIASCERAIELDPAFFGHYHTLGAIYYDLGDFRKCMAYTEEALKRRPEYAPTLGNLGVALVRLGEAEQDLGNVRKGLEYLEASYRLEPSAFTCTSIAITIGRLQTPGYLRRQLDLYPEAARLDPSYGSLWMNWAVALREGFGKYEEALEKLLRAGGALDAFSLYHSNLALTYEHLGDDSLALAHCRRAIACLDEAPWPNLQETMAIGNAFAKQCEMPAIREEGISLLKRATELWPDDHRVLTDYALALYENERYAEAHAAMEASLRIDPNYLFSHANLAILYHREGKPLESLATHLDALRMDLGPFHANIHANLYWLLADRRDFDFGEKLDELREHLETELRSGAQNPQLVWGIWLLDSLIHREKSLPDALSDLESLSAEIPADGGTSAKAFAADAIEALKELEHTSVFRINCGGPAYSDPDGNEWSADRFFLGGDAL